MLDFRSRVHKMLARITNCKDPDQTAQPDLDLQFVRQVFPVTIFFIFFLYIYFYFTQGLDVMVKYTMPK